MTTKRITEEEIKELSVSSLPTRPTAPKAFGGRGYTSSDMKEAFDRLPHLLCERFNALIEDIFSTDPESLSFSIPTGIFEEHTLGNLFAEITSGEAAAYFKVGELSLAEKILDLEERIAHLENQVNTRGGE